MGLLQAPWRFTRGASNLSGTPDAATVGTAFTAGASNSDGSAVAVLSALAFDCHYLIIGIAGISAAGADAQCLLDVLTDPAGGTSYGSFIDDLVCGHTPVLTDRTGIGCWYHFPIFIPAGSSVAVRARTAHGSNIATGFVVAYAYGDPTRPDMWWCGQKVESLGTNAASSKGTDVTPGNSGVDGSWTTIGTSTYRYGAVQYGVNGSDGTAAALGYYWELGVGSQAFPGAPKSYRLNTTSEAGIASGLSQPIWCDVPASTAWQLRATCSGTAEVWNAAVYGVY